jgi:prepilin-type processing-associated H-X9-DG protein
MTDMSYCYLGWVVTSDEEAEAFFEAYDQLSPEKYGEDILNPEDGSILFPALKGRIMPWVCKQDVKAVEERFKSWLPSDRPFSEIPVTWDKPSTDLTKFSHIPLGGNVLYLDGHVEFIRYPGTFPMTGTMARLLDERPREPMPDCEK